jgi:hypothetical protein
MYLAVLDAVCVTVVHVAVSRPLAALVYCVKSRTHSQLNWAILLCEVIPGGKTGLPSQFLTRNSAGLRTALSRRRSHTELRSSLRDSHSFLSLPADTTMLLSQDTQPQYRYSFLTSFRRWASHNIFLSKFHFLLHILRFLFFSDNIMADVASKQQTTALFLSTTITRTTRHTKLTKKLTNLTRNVCCARKYSVQFFCEVFIQLNCTV